MGWTLSKRATAFLRARAGPGAGLVRAADSPMASWPPTVDRATDSQPVYGASQAVDRAGEQGGYRRQANHRLHRLSPTMNWIVMLPLIALTATFAAVPLLHDR